LHNWVFAIARLKNVIQTKRHIDSVRHDGWAMKLDDSLVVKVIHDIHDTNDQRHHHTAIDAWRVKATMKTIPRRCSCSKLEAMKLSLSYSYSFIKQQRRRLW